MLQIPVKEGESIEKALKKYKKKFERTGVLKELRTRKEYIKKSLQAPTPTARLQAEAICCQQPALTQQLRRHALQTALSPVHQRAHTSTKWSEGDEAFQMSIRNPRLITDRHVQATP